MTSPWFYTCFIMRLMYRLWKLLRMYWWIPCYLSLKVGLCGFSVSCSQHVVCDDRIIWCGTWIRFGYNIRSWAGMQRCWICNPDWRDYREKKNLNEQFWNVQEAGFSFTKACSRQLQGKLFFFFFFLKEGCELEAYMEMSIARTLTSWHACEWEFFHLIKVNTNRIGPQFANCRSLKNVQLVWKLGLLSFPFLSMTWSANRWNFFFFF